MVGGKKGNPMGLFGIRDNLIVKFQVDGFDLTKGRISHLRKPNGAVFRK